MNRSDALTEAFVAQLPETDAEAPHFLQAVTEVARDVLTVEKNDPAWARARILARLATPDRILQFRVVREDDAGAVQINRGWRVQASNAIGPYKGGLRFDPSVSVDVLRFLAFEQCFKNALTGLPLGGAKGGSDFDPRGRSEGEIMRFCQAFMRKLAPHIGPDRDVPAGDINVGAREIGYLFGAWRAQTDLYQGALTGKAPSYGGSEIRTEATGYGLIYFVEAMLAAREARLEGQRVAISGKGNVATHAALKALDLGARVVTLSDRKGTLYAADGMSRDDIGWVQAQKAAGGDLTAPPAGMAARFEADTLPWQFEADIALPCATQNEVDARAVKAMIAGGVGLLAEGANMPLTAAAQRAVAASDIVYAPGKASNAGGVAVSGLEMSQTSHRRFMTAAQVDRELRGLMGDLHDRVAEEGRGSGRIDYVRGANVAAYRRLADAITAQGVI